MKKIFIASVAVLALSACGSVTFEQRTSTRIANVSDMGTEIADRVTHSDEPVICPPGQVLIADESRSDSSAETTYSESYGNSRGSRYNTPMSTPNSATGRLEIEVEVDKERRSVCRLPERSR